MRIARHSPARRPGGQAGFTLIELLVGMAAGLIVLAATLSMLVVGTHKHQDVINRADELQQARVGLDRLTHELRQSTAVTATTTPTNTLTVTLPASSTTSVVWTCTTGTGTCTRKAGTGAAVTQLTGLQNAQVFALTPSAADPAYIAITLELAVAGQQPAVLTDGVELRNLNLNN